MMREQKVLVVEFHKEAHDARGYESTKVKSYGIGELETLLKNGWVVVSACSPSVSISGQYFRALVAPIVYILEKFQS